MSSNIQLTSGRTVQLKELHQESVYEGGLEGVPTQADNARLVANLLVRVAKQFSMPVELVPPAESLLDRPANRRGQPAVIPSVACAGRFVSSEPARDSSMHGSHLVVVWFQDDFGLHDHASLDRIKTVDWDAKASDFDW
jgi:hypothetical protein